MTWGIVLPVAFMVILGTVVTWWALVTKEPVGKKGNDHV